MSEKLNLPVRWMRRYKVFFLLGIFIISVQIFLAYKSLSITDLYATDTAAESVYSAWAAGGDTGGKTRPTPGRTANHNSASDDEETVPQPANNRAPQLSSGLSHTLSVEQLGFQPECAISAKEAISALQRAKTKDCRKQIVRVACAIQAGQFYARELHSTCPAGGHKAGALLGCYRDEKEFRLLAGYFTNFKANNSPSRCLQLCLQSGFPYAGVQYGTECFCGVEMPPSSSKLADSSCNMKCSGDAREICGGYFTMNVYETGIDKFTARIAETSAQPHVERVRIAFLLTLNGRALRQVHRLIRALYAPQHVFFIHVDARQDYLYRQLLQLESQFPNIRLARQRFSTIWGGASLLTMLLHSMQDLLASSWHWDFVINLSESDFPVKSMDKLVEFLTANRGRNFVKSHGRETQRFIQKQGLDKTFVECDTHMWRIGDRELPAGLQVDGGSDWIALSRSFVQFIIREQHGELLSGLLTIFRHTLLPAESFFHTVLRNTHFCNTYVDNNLHVTNWKRKLGCKCQYKHVVDWCGCSPNDFKPDDWNRLQGTEQKMLYFARKFEPVVSQAIILQLEEWLFGPYTSEYVNLHAYWQSLYHTEDRRSMSDDVVRTVAESLLRLLERKLQLQAHSSKLLEITDYFAADQYKGFLLRYAANDTDGTPLQLETRIRPMQYAQLAKNSRLAKRLRSFEVSSDFDQKEQLSRNFAKFLGPYTEPVLSFSLAAGAHSAAESHSYNLTVLWLDPLGQLQDSVELHIEDAQVDAINFSKATFKHPLTPGIWTAKLIGRSAIYAQTRFLVTPLALEAGQPIRVERSRMINAGSSLATRRAGATPTEWQQHLPAAGDVQLMRQLAQAHAELSGAELLGWVDELVSKFYHVRETCRTYAELQPVTVTVAKAALANCKETAWSSLAADPKSDVSTLPRRR